VTASIDPVAQATSYRIVYDRASSPWCRSGGSSGTPSFTTARVRLPFTDLRTHAVTATVTGLSARTSYCIALAARNGSGTTNVGQSALPANVKVTVDILVGEVLANGPNSIVSPRDGFSCQSTCSRSFPRGTQLDLYANLGRRWTFTWWNPPNGGYGPTPAPPCASSDLLACAITLVKPVTVYGQFTENPQPPCLLLPAGPRVKNESLTILVKCVTPVTIALTGLLRERSQTDGRSTFAELNVERTRPRTTWTLHPRLPPDAVAALRSGAVESVRFTLTYQNPSIGTGLATASLARLLAHTGARP
jgi:hypothetical protein